MKNSNSIKLSFLIFLGILLQAPMALTGVVVEEHMKEPVMGAKVSVGGTVVYTDDKGRFTISPSPILPGGLQTTADLFIQNGSLTISLNAAAEVSFELFDSKGKMIRHENLKFLQVGKHNLTDASSNNNGNVREVRYLRLKVNEKSSIHKVLAFSQDGKKQIHVSTPSLHKRADVEEFLMDGKISFEKELLNSKTMDYAAADTDMGIIELSYPKRQLDLGAKPPYGAIMLFDGSGTKAEAEAEMKKNWQPWANMDGTNNDATGITFKIVKDPKIAAADKGWSMMSCCHYPWGYDDLQAKEVHGDVQIHIEFNMLGKYDDNDEADPNPGTQMMNRGGGGYSNSGVYLQSRYEVQIVSVSLDKRDLILTNSHKMASLVDDHTPTSDEWKANGEWQSYDITFRKQ